MDIFRALGRPGPLRWVGLWLVVGVLQLVAPAAQSAAGPCQDRGTGDYAPTTRAIFNDPTGKVAEQFRIQQTIVDNINATPPGEDIRISTLAINAKAVVNAITSAHACRVHVRMLVPASAWDDRTVLGLRQLLGEDVSANSFIAQCEGSCTTTGAEGLMHAKSYQFSKVGKVRHVTIYSSSNLTRHQATTRWQDAYQVTDEPAVYASAASYFDKLSRNTATRFARLTKTVGYWQYYFPSQQDLHLDLLDRTECQSSVGPTTVTFVAAIFKEVAVADRLGDLRDAGCDVRVVVVLEKAGRAVLQALYDRGVPTQFQSVDDPTGSTHSKYVAIRGLHDGYVVNTVYCGSTNVSDFSIHSANNNMLRIVDDEPAYDAYHRNFDRLWEVSRPLTQADIDAAERVDARAAEQQD
jgi:phosphatidylserine/phosphatidylglycerophosphate/cardiolipin synthase-like enzyme